MRIIYSLIVAITRGVQYALLDKVLVSVPVVVLCFISSIFNTIFFGILFYLGNYSSDFKKYFADKNVLRLFILITVLYLISSSLILVAIKNKNATVASLIEISYPIFVVLFTYLFYKNIQIHRQTILGGSMIL
ncbi:MAG: EamA family transporter [bacterium]